MEVPPQLQPQQPAQQQQLRPQPAQQQPAQQQQLRPQPLLSQVNLIPNILQFWHV